MPRPLPNWTRRDNFRVPPHQALVDAANETGSITPPDGQDFHRTPKGSGLVDTREQAWSELVFLAKPTDKAARPGVYTGSVWEVNAVAFDPDDTGPWSADDLGAAEDGEAVIVNLLEEGLDTWALIDGATADDGANADLPPQLFPAVYLGALDDGRELFCISGFKWEPCS